MQCGQGARAKPGPVVHTRAVGQIQDDSACSNKPNHTDFN